MILFNVFLKLINNKFFYFILIIILNKNEDKINFLFCFIKIIKF